MITRDFILRQVHQLSQALARVLFHKKAAEEEQAQEVLTATLRDVTGLNLDQIRRLNRNEILEMCSAGGALSAEKAVAVADLLREDPSLESRRRALWLYEAALEAGGAVPIDIHDRIVALRDSEEDG